MQENRENRKLEQKHVKKHHQFTLMRVKAAQTLGPKCTGRSQGKLRRTREARRMDKKPKIAQSSVDRAPATSLWRARAFPYLMGKFLLVAHLRDPDGAPAPPYFVTSKTRTSCARAMEVVRSCRGDRTH
ncbi:hypothetical protein PIB30_048994 [Stylosanthes scabra]|uniref:Uncharacterized protein n=1 Tax=Stylosanthes scabra TaxID=79078 RepID=A0ABU6YG23_9FABA|nr:hypothetical protein [Stylosanthes scabra]